MTRTRWRLNSVSGRLTFWYVGTLAFSLAAFATFVLVVRAGSLRSELDSQLTSQLASLAPEIMPHIDRPDAARMLDVQAAITSSPLTIRRDNGTVVYRSPAVPSLPSEWENAIAIGAANRLSFHTVRDTTRREYRLVNRFVVSAGGSTYALQLLGPADGIDEGINELAAVQGIGILLVLTVARYGSAFTARRALAPIDEIIRRGRDIQGKAVGERLKVEADTIELEQLVLSLNEMLERLEEPVKTAHRFAASVSHELQTPIAAMRFALEAVQRADRPADDYAVIADDLVSELDRLSTLVRDLRLLAVAGAGAAQLIAAQESFDIGEVTQQCCEIARAVGEAKDISIAEHLCSGVIVTGSALHLRRAILNLTDNAIRYSQPGSSVVVRVEFDGSLAAISVRDQGCGINPEDLPRIFEPFFRADRARARETGGSGLGLAIADQVVRAHRGRITVTSAPHQGSTFTIHVPAVMASAHLAQA